MCGLFRAISWPKIATGVGVEIVLWIVQTLLPQSIPLMVAIPILLIGIGLITWGISGVFRKIPHAESSGILIQHSSLGGQTAYIPFDNLSKEAKRLRQSNYTSACREMRVVHLHVDSQGLKEAKRTGAPFNAEGCWKCGGNRFTRSPWRRGPSRIKENTHDDSNNPRDNSTS